MPARRGLLLGFLPALRLRVGGTGASVYRPNRAADGLTGREWCISLFFGLAFAITWTSFITVAMGVPASTAPGRFLILLGAFSPAIAALSVTALQEGRPGTRALLGRILIGHVPRRYYAFAVFYLITMKLTAALLHWMVIGAWPRFSPQALMLSPIAIAVSLPLQAGEEIGWRGYALPRLAQRLGLARASLVLGVIWAAWHLPQFYIPEADTYQQSFVVWSLQVVAMSVAFAWLFARTGGSLLLVMLLHAAINNTKDIIPSGLASPEGVFSLHASAMSWLTLPIMWGCAAYLLRQLHRADRVQRSG
jgi:membrane protease YdiL (CAAX protease family)